mmetsp:Transcript_27097/g.63003  ORF Transcript_27097/g.63003 Transcript_27097/m.63003 type:complete len:231 (-) Transcript_27097:962-1654(-)
MLPYFLKYAIIISKVVSRERPPTKIFSSTDAPRSKCFFPALSRENTMLLTAWPIEAPEPGGRSAAGSAISGLAPKLKASGSQPSTGGDGSAGIGDNVTPSIVRPRRPSAKMRSKSAAGTNAQAGVTATASASSAAGARNKPKASRTSAAPVLVMCSATSIHKDRQSNLSVGSLHGTGQPLPAEASMETMSCRHLFAHEDCTHRPGRGSPPPLRALSSRTRRLSATLRSRS